MGEGNRGFVTQKCKYINCYTTIQRREIFQSDKRIDAVIIHGWDRDLNNELQHGRISENGVKVGKNLAMKSSKLT